MKDTNRILSAYKPEVLQQLKILRGLLWPSGATSASTTAHYRNYWVRDGLYVLKAFEYLNLLDDVEKMINVPLIIFQRYNQKIYDGIRKKPNEHYQYLHARYDPNNFNELEGNWGHNQLDMLGLFLFEIADLIKKKNLRLLHSHRNRDLVNWITRYLETLKWWECPDFGMWEEGPELHASSIGAILGGLLRLQSLKNQDIFFNEEQIAMGKKTLRMLLPLESKSVLQHPDFNRPYDMAQLSLIWPFRVVTREEEIILLENIEKNLVRQRGVIRYPCDGYWNSSDNRLIETRHHGISMINYREGTEGFSFKHKGTEAEWPLGFAWLSIVYSKIAKQKFEKKESYEDEKTKAHNYLEKLRSVKVTINDSDYYPELYSKGLPNINTPLAWTTAFFIIAVRAYEEIENQFVPYHLS